MGRKKSRKNPAREYFKKQYAEHPEWVQETSNNPMYEQWKADHGGKDMTDAQKKTLFSVKTTLRSEARGGSPVKKKKPGRKPGPKPGKPSQKSLEQLEINIDNCLQEARSLQDVAGLTEVIGHLRRARNNCIVMLESVSK